VKAKLTIAAAMLLVAACAQDQTTPKAVEAIGAAAANGSSQPVQFELRDFGIKKQSADYGAQRYTGHGTLVTRDQRLSNGNYILWLSVKQAQENDQEITFQILLKDGIGTVETADYQTSEEEKTEKVRYYDWSILGYTPLLPANLQSLPPSASAESSQQKS